MGENKLLVKLGWKGWGVLDMEYSAIVCKMNLGDDVCPVPAVFQPRLVAFEFH